MLFREILVGSVEHCASGFSQPDEQRECRTLCIGLLTTRRVAGMLTGRPSGAEARMSNIVRRVAHNPTNLPKNQNQYEKTNTT